MRTFTLNLASVIAGELLLRAANLAAVVVIARLYGPTVLGAYVAVLAWVTVAATVADNGMQVSTMTQMSRQPHDRSAVWSRVLLAKTVLTVPLLGLLTMAGLLMQLSAGLWCLAALVTARVVAQSYCQTNLAVLKSLGRMPAIGIVQALHSVLLAAGVAVVYRSQPPLVVLLGVLLAGQLFELSASGALLWRTRLRLVRVRLVEALGMLRRSTPIGFSYGLASLILRLDVIVLAGLVTAGALGQFAAAHVLIALTYVIAWLFGSVLLPELLRLADDAESLERQVRLWSMGIVLAGIPAAVLGGWLAPRMVPRLYGAEYADAGALAAVMLLAVPLILLNSVQFTRAVALGCASLCVRTYAATALIALLLNMTLGYAYGGLGVALGITLREAAMFGLFRLQEQAVSPTSEQQA
jgi:O-antigen/teichoic acid export membrane protein